MTNIANSVLRYNTVDIPFIKTEKFVQEPTWSPDGTDLLYTHIIIGVSGVLNSCFLNGVDPATWIETYRPALLQRGGQLYFFVGGNQLLPQFDTGQPTTGHELVASPAYSNPVSGSGMLVNATTVGAAAGASLPCFQDARLGPRPIRLDIRSIKGNSFSIYYEIETWVPYCWYGGLPPGVLSVRWESTLDIDKEYYYQRTTSGVMILNSQYVNSQTVGYNLLSSVANIIFPLLMASWKRETVRMVMSSDNLTLSYQIVDRQQYAGGAIPRPAVAIDAHYTEVSPPEGVGKSATGTSIVMMNFQQLNMEVTVTGDPNWPEANSWPTSGGSPNQLNPDKLKWELMKIMFQLIFSRIQFPFTQVGPLWQQNQFITRFELHEDVMRPIVGCRVSALQSRRLESGPAGSPAVWQGTDGVFSLTNVAQPLLLQDMINQVATMPVNLGNYASFLFVQSICPKEPCGGIETPIIGATWSIPPTQVFTTQVSSSNTSNNVISSQSYPTSFSQANYNHPFTEYSATVDYHTDNHVLQLPVMNTSGNISARRVGSGGTAPDAVFCQTANPTTRKIVHWKASRLGSWPLAPKPDSLDYYGDSFLKDKVLNYQVGFGEVEISNDGITRHYVITGVYEIGLARRLQWESNTALTIICNPTIASAVFGDADSTYPTSGFVDGILSIGPSPGTE